MLQSLKKNGKGIALMLICSLCLCSSQLLWKTMGNYEMPRSIIQLMIGFVICGGGGIAMVYAYRCGELSVIHPLNSASYVFSTILSVAVLHEPLVPLKVIGIAVVIVGVIFIGGSDEE